MDRSGEPTVRVARVWVRWILGTIGIRVEVEGLEHCDLENPGVVMSNHRSVFDIAALVHVMPTSFRFVAKKELTRVPFFGWALALSQQIIIDRKSRARAIRAMAEGAKQIRGGTKVLVFPEGTRSETEEMRPFKSGGFHLAITNGWPVIPLGVAGSDEITPKGSLRVEPGTIRLVFGPPVSTVGLDDSERNRLKREVRSRIEQLIEVGEASLGVRSTSA